MWCLFSVLLLCGLVETSKLFKSWKKDPLVVYVYEGSDQNGHVVEKIRDEKWSLLLGTLKKSLHITNHDKLHNELKANKDANIFENKPSLRICTYDHPCKVKKVKKEESCEQREEDKCREKETDSIECEEINKC